MDSIIIYKDGEYTRLIRGEKTSVTKFKTIVDAGKYFGVTGYYMDDPVMWEGTWKTVPIGWHNMKIQITD